MAAVSLRGCVTEHECGVFVFFSASLCCNMFAKLEEGCGLSVSCQSEVRNELSAESVRAVTSCRTRQVQETEGDEWEVVGRTGIGKMERKYEV